MSKISIITLPFRKNHLIQPVYGAIFAQTHKDLEVIAVINDPTDGSKEILQKNYPQVKIVEPGWNTWFAVGGNIGIKNSSGEFILMGNDDLILMPNYIEEILKVFDDPKVASAGGKLLWYDFANNRQTKIIDTTGILIERSGRARDRGQHQEDCGQFDNETDVFGLSGAGTVYRRSVLEQVKYQDEYFDADFLAYWEDVDMAWRFKNLGFKNIFVPSAVAYHGRTAGQAKGGYSKVFNFIKHHKKLPAIVRRLNYKNHILMYIKNARFFHPLFFLRELAMFGYIIVFETSTLKVMPELFRQVPKIWKKRKAWISRLS